MNPAALKAIADGNMDNFIAASTPGGIERQEAQGQQMLVASEQIPREIRGATRDELVALGFVFGADIDELFVACTLPAGWSKRATDHSMHSDVLDEKGRIRAAIFYKAAFYDRRADMRMSSRFNVSAFEGGKDDDHYRTTVTDAGAVIFEIGERHHREFDLGDEHEKAALAWLDERHPDWRNPLAYWASA